MNNYPYYNYNNNYYVKNLQDMREQIDRQLQSVQMQQPPQTQQPQINQTFQLSNPQQSLTDFDGKYVEGIEDVKKFLVYKNSAFLDKDMTTLWFKDVSGNIKTFALSEIIEKDEKDKQIENLQKQLDDMRSILLSTSNRQIEPFSNSSNEIILDNNKNASTSQIDTNTSINNNIVKRKNKMEVNNNEQRNN